MTSYDTERYSEEYDGTPADWDAEHNYDQRTGKVYGATKWTSPYFAKQLNSNNRRTRNG